MTGRLQIVHTLKSQNKVLKMKLSEKDEEINKIKKNIKHTTYS